MKIGFIGVGKLGKEVSEVMVEGGHKVEGYDIDPTAAPKGVVMVDSVEDVVRGKEIIFIAVPTPHDPRYDGRYPCTDLEPKNFNYEIVKEVVREVDKYATKEQLVVLISTVLPGTVRREIVPVVHNFRFIYNPYLIAMGTVKYDMVHPEMIIIGTEDGDETGDAKLLVDFYKTLMVPETRIEIGTWDEAESIKIFYNTYISTKVVLMNMIQDVAEKVGNINVDVVANALKKSTYRITGPAYMVPGMGDGGGCHPRDNIALRWMSKEYGLGYDIFQAVMQAREIQAKNLAKRLQELSDEAKIPVFILGKSYKPRVPYLEGSSSMLVGSYLKSKPVYDPEVLLQGVYLLGHKDEFVGLKFPEGSVVLDPWRQYKDPTGKVRVVHYGNTRKEHVL